MIDKTEKRYMLAFNGVWFLLLVQYFVFRWDLSLKFAIVWGVLSLMHTLPILMRCAVKKIFTK